MILHKSKPFAQPVGPKSKTHFLYGALLPEQFLQIFLFDAPSQSGNVYFTLVGTGIRSLFPPTRIRDVDAYATVGLELLVIQRQSISRRVW